MNGVDGRNEVLVEEEEEEFAVQYLFCVSPR